MPLNDPRAGINIRLYPGQISALLNGPQGPVYRRLIEDAERVKVEAQRLVGVHQPVPGERRSRRPGTLRDSIVKRPAMEGDTITFVVGSDDPIALLHHEGTQPHVIAARRKPRLVFFWPKVGRVVSFKRVNHPGTKPNRYLTDALRVLG